MHCCPPTSCPLACPAGLLEAPRADKRPHTLEAHGHARQDDYYWLRDDERQDPAVLAHLKAEAAYTKAVLADTEALQDELYREMRGRIQEADQGTPIRRGGAQQRGRGAAGDVAAGQCQPLV